MFKTHPISLHFAVGMIRTINKRDVHPLHVRAVGYALDKINFWTAIHAVKITYKDEYKADSLQDTFTGLERTAMLMNGLMDPMKTAFLFRGLDLRVDPHLSHKIINTSKDDIWKEAVIRAVRELDSGCKMWVTHETRNAMTELMGFAELGEMFGDEKGATNKSWKRILGYSRSIEKMVDIFSMQRRIIMDDIEYILEDETKDWRDFIKASAYSILDNIESNPEVISKIIEDKDKSRFWALIKKMHKKKLTLPLLTKYMTEVCDLIFSEINNVKYLIDNKNIEEAGNFSRVISAYHRFRGIVERYNAFTLEETLLPVVTVGHKDTSSDERGEIAANIFGQRENKTGPLSQMVARQLERRQASGDEAFDEGFRLFLEKVSNKESPESRINKFIDEAMRYYKQPK